MTPVTHGYINNPSQQSLLVHFDNFTNNYTTKTLEHMHYPYYIIHPTQPIIKKYVEILLHYRWLFIKGNVIIGEWGIFGV